MVSQPDISLWRVELAQLVAEIIGRQARDVAPVDALGVRLGHPWLADVALAACISVTIWAAWSSQPVSSAAVGASS